MTVTFFAEKKKLVLEFMYNYKRPEIPKMILKKKKNWKIPLCCVRMYHGNSNQDCVVLR